MDWNWCLLPCIRCVCLCVWARGKGVHVMCYINLVDICLRLMEWMCLLMYSMCFISETKNNFHAGHDNKVYSILWKEVSKDGLMSTSTRIWHQKLWCFFLLLKVRHTKTPYSSFFKGHHFPLVIKTHIPSYFMQPAEFNSDFF